MQKVWVGSPGGEDTVGGGNGNPLQYSCLENSMDRGAWWAIVQGVANSQTRLSDFTSLESLYDLVPLSTVQQSESAVHVHMSPLFWNSFPFRSPQSIKHSPCTLQ